MEFIGGVLTASGRDHGTWQPSVDRTRPDTTELSSTQADRAAVVSRFLLVWLLYYSEINSYERKQTFRGCLDGDFSGRVVDSGHQPLDGVGQHRFVGNRKQLFWPRHGQWSQSSSVTTRQQDPLHQDTRRIPRGLTSGRKPTIHSTNHAR